MWCSFILSLFIYTQYFRLASVSMLCISLVDLCCLLSHMTMKKTYRLLFVWTVKNRIFFQLSFCSGCKDQKMSSTVTLLQSEEKTENLEKVKTAILKSVSTETETKPENTVGQAEQTKDSWKLTTIYTHRRANRETRHSLPKSQRTTRGKQN